MQALPIGAVARNAAAQATLGISRINSDTHRMLSWFASHAVGPIARCFYYSFMIVVVIRSGHANFAMLLLAASTRSGAIPTDQDRSGMDDH
jgi:hypothetical protein